VQNALRNHWPEYLMEAAELGERVIESWMFRHISTATMPDKRQPR